MNLTINDFIKGRKLFSGQITDRFYCDGKEIFRLSSNEYFIREDTHHLSIFSFYPNIQVYNIHGKLVLVFEESNTYTTIQLIKVVESNTIQPFNGFELNKEYSLSNGQIWKQISGPHAPNHISSGNVKIINDSILIVDSWEFYPKVKRIK